MQKKKMYWDLGILPLINLDIVAFFQNNIVKNCWNNLRRISFLGGGSSILISSTTGTGSCGGGGGGTGSGGGVGSWAGVGSGGGGEGGVSTTGSGLGAAGTFCFFGLVFFASSSWVLKIFFWKGVDILILVFYTIFV